MRYQLFAMLVLTFWAQVKRDLRPLPPEPPRVRWGADIRIVIDGALRDITLERAARPAPADEDDDPRPARLVVMPLDLNSAVMDRDNFDRWLFADGGYEMVRQRHLDDILQDKVEAAARKHKLTEAQRAKLRVAGRGDIKRFFDQVEDRRREFERDRRSFKTGLAALGRLTPLSRIYQEGPFGDGSLFAKTLHRINDDQKAGQ
jgi:hypothetical protein